MLRHISHALALRLPDCQPLIQAILLVLVICPLGNADATPERIDLSGTWSFQLDPTDQGLAERWFAHALAASLQLPGSLQAQGFGDPPRLDSQWTGTIRPEVIEMPRYAPYRDADNFKMPFWLQPKHAYVGPAWYQRSVTVPATWLDNRIVLHLERCHWFTQVWVDERHVGANDSLSVPHAYDLTEYLSPGTHQITIRVDNRINIDVGSNAHSVSDHTQTNWNGIVGVLELKPVPMIAVDDVQIFPDVTQRSADVRLVLVNHRDQAAHVELCIAAFQHDKALAAAAKSIYLDRGATQHQITLPLSDDVQLWSEHAPHMCAIEVTLYANPTSNQPLDKKRVDFGMREISALGSQFLLNGQPLYFRGTLECCIFPLTGFPPTDVESWKHVVKRCKEFGLNHIRFHSWCPPEAAFAAADELGFYYQVECASWANGTASVGDGKPLDEWLYREADRIQRAYGNHPSFMLFAYGNEPSGPGPRRQGEDYLGKWVDHYKPIASRQLVTCASGWPYIDENAFHVMHSPLRQRGVFNRQEPSTAHDYQQHVAAYNVPLISHETGQWCIFPNLDEIGRYCGLLEATNFEIVRDFLETHGLSHQARDFLWASGQLQSLLYKEEIEVMLRTAGLGGFQLLDLHDFPGQGTALIGVLDPFWEPKPYITADRFRRFCGPVVPLARSEHRVWTNDQMLRAHVEIYQFGDADLTNHPVNWKVTLDNGRLLGEGTWRDVDLSPGGLRQVGDIACSLAGVSQASHLRLTVAIHDTPYSNDWDMWVYPSTRQAETSKDILVTRILDQAAKEHLQVGGKVLFLPPVQTIEGDTAGSFEPIFWNRLWFPTQRVHTLGVLCNPNHPALADFPTDAHSNWQWWDLCNQCKPMIVDELPELLNPIVQVIDDWNTCRKLALAFEVKIGKGKLLVCSADLHHDLADRPVARQLRHSLLRYMATPAFDPQVAVDLQQLASLLRSPTNLQRLEAKVSTNSAQPGYEAINAIDGNPDTIWHTAWGSNAPHHPHELVLDLRSTQLLSGLVYQPRGDMSNGRIARFTIHLSQDGKQWGSPVASGTWPDSAEMQQVRFAQPQSGRFVKLVAESETRGNFFASAAEIDVLLAE